MMNIVTAYYLCYRRLFFIELLRASVGIQHVVSVRTSEAP